MWITAEIRAQIREKHRLYRRYKKKRCPEAWDKYRQVRNAVASHLKKAKSLFVLNRLADASSHANDLPGNPEESNRPRLQTLLRSLLKQKPVDIPDLCDPSQTLPKATTDLGKAELLNRFFISQFRQSASPGAVLPIRTPRSPLVLDRFQVSYEQVANGLRTINTRKAPGADGIPPKLLQNLMVAQEVSPTVHHLFNTSLNTGALPEEWKSAMVTAIYKQRGSRNVVSNYRPISLLSNLSKILESIVFKQLLDHVDHYLPINQSGFRKGENTTFQIVRIVQKLSGAIETGQYALSCFHDLSKAFDRVWHAGLLCKLEHLGVRGKALDWLKDYLTTREQQVRVNGTPSSRLKIPAEVPQGSVLGPLLFLIYTSDLPEAVADVPGSSCEQFADDTNLTTINSRADQTEDNLQVAINQTASWLRVWRLCVNPQKTVIMETSRRPLPTPLSIKLAQDALTKVQSHRHLGVILSHDLRWSNHVDYILTKATRLLSVLRRLRSSLDQESLSHMYLTYIRPILEYACTAWGNLGTTQVDRLERFQRRAAKIILRRPLFAPSNHDELLATIGWPSLASRRKYFRAVLGHCMATSNVPQHLKDYIPSRPTHMHNTRKPPFFQLPTTNTSLMLNSPLYQAADTFNALPAILQSASNLTSFKNGAALFLLTCQCTCSKHTSK